MFREDLVPFALNDVFSAAGTKFKRFDNDETAFNVSIEKREL